MKSAQAIPGFSGSGSSGQDHGVPPALQGRRLAPGKGRVALERSLSRQRVVVEKGSESSEAAKTQPEAFI